MITAINSNIEDMNNNMEWKLLSSLSGATTVDITSVANSAKEFICYIWSSSYPSKVFSIHILKQVLGNVIYTGYYYTSDNNGSCRIESSSTYLRIGHIAFSGSPVETSTFRISTYYR